MFLSADIIGSTSLKQQIFSDETARTPNTQWAKEIQYFYDGFPALLRQEWAELAKKMVPEDKPELFDELFGSAPTFWKTIGDEIVFWKELTDARQVWTVVATWLNAVQKKRKDWEGKPLDIKSYAWVAGFPVRNRLVVKADDEALVKEALAPASDPSNPFHAKARIVDAFYGLGNSADASIDATSQIGDYFKGFVDFIGPAIDIGFRLGSMASSRKFVLSLDAVYLMAQSRDDIWPFARNQDALHSGIGRSPANIDASEPFGGKLGIHYSGTEYLKGVIGGVKYPRFWINSEEGGSIDSGKSILNSQWVQPIKNKDLVAFCETFYNDRRKFIAKPFIYKNSEAPQSDPNVWDGHYADMFWHAARQIDEIWWAANKPKNTSAAGPESAESLIPKND